VNDPIVKVPWLTARRDVIVDLAIQIVCLALLAYWTTVLIQPFLTIFIWSVIFAVVLYPAFQWMVGRFRMPRLLAALLITAFSLLVLLGPAAWLGLSLIESLRSIAARLDAGNILVPPPPAAIKDWPLIGGNVHSFWSLASTNLKAALVQIGPQLRPFSSKLLEFASSTALSMLKFVAAVLVSGFLLLPGPALVGAARVTFRRIAARRGDEFVDLIGATIRNLARGVIGVSLLQALLAGIGFLVVGIPTAGLLSFLILLLGITQIDAAVVTIPLLIWSWLTMDTTAALLFTIYMVPVTVLNNFLRPFVMAHGLKTPTSVIFVGVIGGLLAHGLIGVFIGPIVLAIAWELLRAWTRAPLQSGAASVL
jgi:predicted PurR-regulated permease PerM